MKLFRLSLASVVLFVFHVSLSAQTPTPKPNADDDDIIKVTSRLVVVPVSVTDANGEPVTGLTKESFRVAEDGRRQEIDQVSDAEKTPLEIALLIDISKSVDPLFEFEKQTAAQFLQTVMKPEDRATIFVIGEKPNTNVRSQTATDAATYLRTLSRDSIATAFYDTVGDAATYLRRHAPEHSRRVIVALTDGEDTWSKPIKSVELSALKDLNVNKLTRKDLDLIATKTNDAHMAAQTKILRDLQNADTVFYSINPAGDSYRLNKISMRAQTAMDKFANQTGGTAFIPKFLTTTNTKEPLQNAGNANKNKETLVRIFKQLASELRAQYLIQYYSESDFPVDRFIKLDVGLNDPAGKRVRARQGYYVKN